MCHAHPRPCRPQGPSRSPDNATHAAPNAPLAARGPPPPGSGRVWTAWVPRVLRKLARRVIPGDQTARLEHDAKAIRLGLRPAGGSRSANSKKRGAPGRPDRRALPSSRGCTAGNARSRAPTGGNNVRHPSLESRESGSRGRRSGQVRVARFGERAASSWRPEGVGRVVGRARQQASKVPSRRISTDPSVDTLGLARVRGGINRPRMSERDRASSRPPRSVPAQVLACPEVRAGARVPWERISQPNGSAARRSKGGRLTPRGGSAWLRVTVRSRPTA